MKVYNFIVLPLFCSSNRSSMWQKTFIHQRFKLYCVLQIFDPLRRKYTLISKKKSNYSYLTEQQKM